MDCCFFQVDRRSMPSLAPEEGEAASPCAAGKRSPVASPVRHMHSDVAELLLAAGTSPRRRQRKRHVSASAAAELRGRARYDGAFEEEPQTEEEEERGFAPPRLVWAKVRGHPWWPGQVFDPSDASALARRQKRRGDAVLVACFGDRSFVWAGAEDLLPFRDGFPRLADVGARSTSKAAFACAMDDALDEVARRVNAGLSCGCGAASITKQVFVNDGLRRGARGAGATDAAFTRDTLRGEAFVRYVRALAVTPEAGADRLDFSVAAAQMTAFNRWRSPGNAEHDSTAGADHVARGAMVAAARAGRVRATTPKRGRTRRGLSPCDAPAGDPALSMRARAAAAADEAFMRIMFPAEGREERHDLAVAITPQRKAFDQWRGAPSGGIAECTGTCGTMDVAIDDAMEAATRPPAGRGTAKKARSKEGDDADDDGDRMGAVLTSCISSGRDSAREIERDYAWETESDDDFEPASKWELGWKDHVMIIQFVAIVMLVCHLMRISISEELN